MARGAAGVSLTPEEMADETERRAAIHWVRQRACIMAGLPLNFPTRVTFARHVRTSGMFYVEARTR